MTSLNQEAAGANMKINIKKLNAAAIIPRYAKPGDAGMDLVAISRVYSSDYVEYGTGVAFEIPSGYVGLVFPRSSISNVGHSLCNAVGVLDSGYRGEVTFRMRYKRGMKHYEVGDRVGQIVVMPFPEIELVEVGNLTDSIRGEGGYGSSGA